MEIKDHPAGKDNNIALPATSPGFMRNLLIVTILLIGLICATIYLIRGKNQPAITPSKEPSSNKLASAEHHDDKADDDHAGEHHDEHGDEHGAADAIAVDSEMAALMGIKVATATKGEIEASITTTGRVLATGDGQAIIGAKVNGRAEKVLVQVGQQVKAGQPLIIIDSPQIADLRGQLLEAQARLKLAEQKRVFTAKNENRAAVIQSKNRLDLAQANFERKQRLANLGATATREVAEAETEYKNAKAEYDYQASIKITREQQEAESEVEQANVNVKRLKYSLAALGASTNGEGGLITINAPINGTVIERSISIGEAITADKELMTVINTSTVIIEALLPESQAQQIHQGQTITARIPGSQSDYVTGTVQSIAINVEPTKRTVAVRAKVANTQLLLRHEMSVDISIAAGERKEALLIPVSALVDEDGLKIVYVKEAEHYQRRIVTVGTITYQHAEILSGIEDGAEVVITGAYQLANMAKGGGEEGDHHDD